MAESIRDFKDLIVWQKAIALAKDVYVLTMQFPKEERFDLTSQLRRAAVSVSSNIAEGHSRQGREYLYFLSIARGSLEETESQLLLAVELQYVAAHGITPLCQLASESRRMASALSRKLVAPDP